MRKLLPLALLDGLLAAHAWGTPLMRFNLHSAVELLKPLQR
jgi:hypothetical protein